MTKLEVQQKRSSQRAKPDFNVGPRKPHFEYFKRKFEYGIHTVCNPDSLSACLVPSTVHKFAFRVRWTSLAATSLPLLESDIPWRAGRPVHREGQALRSACRALHQQGQALRASCHHCGCPFQCAACVALLELHRFHHRTGA